MNDTSKRAAPKKAPAKKPAKPPEKAAQAAAPENKDDSEAVEGETPAHTPEQKRQALEIAAAANRLAKGDDGNIDVTAELIAINRKLEFLAASMNVRLPQR